MEHTHAYAYAYASGESGGSISRDEYISQVAQDIQNKLPKLFDMDVIRKKFGTDISPTSVVLLQELERFNKLVVRMQRSLAELKRVRGSGSATNKQRGFHMFSSLRVS